MPAVGVRTLWALSLLALLPIPGCTSGAGGWDVRGLERRHPELSLHSGHRLGDASPYFAPSEDGLALFLCRWSTARAVPVALPSDASPGERDLLLRALAAWEGAGLGLEFSVGARVTGPGPRRGIEIEFVDDPERGAPAGSGDTVADCAISATAAPSSNASVAAELEYASVYLRRTRPDLLDRTVPLSSTELLGAAVHELGHALGFSGHVAWGSSLMSSRNCVRPINFANWSRPSLES